VLVAVHEGLLDVVMDGGFHGRHEPRAHVEAFRAEGKRRGQLRPRRAAARRNKGDVELLGGDREQQPVARVQLPRVPGALKPIHRNHVHAQPLRRLGVADGHALVDDVGACLFEPGDERCQPFEVPGRLHHGDLLVHDDLCVLVVVGRRQCREKGQVDAHGLVCQGLGQADLCTEGLRGGLRERRDHPHAAGLGHGGGQRREADMVHPTLNYRVGYPECTGEDS